MTQTASEKPRGGAPRTELPKECIALLGKESDCALAKRFGVSSTLLFNRRRALGIKASRDRRQPVVWTDGMLLLIGTATDLEIAKQLGLPEYIVAHKRKQMGISSCVRNTASRERSWTPEMIKMLGRLTDDAFAERFGLGKSTVVAKRHALGIEPKRATRKTLNWTWEMLHEIRTMHPSDFAQKYGIGRSTAVMKRAELKLPPAPQKPDPRKVRWTDRMQALIGTKPNYALARAFHVSISAVERERRRLGIKAWRVQQRFKWTEDKTAQLGTATDAELARRWGGISPSAIGCKRISLGIPRYSGRRQKPVE